MGLWGGFRALVSGKPQPRYARRGFGFSAGVAVDEDTAMKVSAFYRGVMYISTQIAKLPWEVKDATNAIMTGPISDMLSLAPNEEMNAMKFRLLALQTAMIKGNFYAEIERDLRGFPTAMWWVPTENVEPVRGTDQKLYYRVMGSSAPNGDFLLRPKDMFHLANFHTRDGIIGQGVVAYAIETLGIAAASDRMAAGMFQNSGLPSGVLTSPTKLEDEAFQRLKRDWAENFNGRKSGGTAILEEGMTYSPVNFAPDVMQFLESRKFSVLEIARYLNLPPTKLFDTEKSTHSNQEQSNLEVATDVLDSWARMLESEVDIKLLSTQYGGRYSEIDMLSLMRGDMASRSDYYQKMAQTAAMTPNEIRNREGLVSYPEGDRYYVATNNFTPVDRVDDVIDANIKKSEPAPAPKEAQRPTDAQLNPPAGQDSKKALLDEELTRTAIEFMKK